MPILAIGLNHTTASVALRERVAFTAEHLPHALTQLNALPQIQESVILSTCNRTEIFCCSSQENPKKILDWLSDYHHIPSVELNEFLYVHTNQTAVAHLLSVASGLNSMVLGEPQILGQVKQAYQAAQKNNTVGTRLHRLFQHTFNVAKQIRTDTAIGGSAVSVAFAAVRLAKQIFGDFSSQTALLIGAGETIELTARHLYENKIGRIIVANRTLERAHTLAQQFNGYAISLSEISIHLAEADIIIASTASETTILSYNDVAPPLKNRQQRRPMLMIDLAVPRDIDPKVDDFEDVYLYTVDHLQDIIDEGLKNRQEAAQQAHEIIDYQTRHFMQWLHAQQYTDDIRLFRDTAHNIREKELNQTLKMLNNGALSAEDALQRLAHALTNKLIHSPTVRMKRAALEGLPDTLAIARDLFSLHATANKSKK